MILLLIYILGCFVSYFILSREYELNKPESEKCEDAVAILVVGVSFSWVLVLWYLVEKHNVKP